MPLATPLSINFIDQHIKHNTADAYYTTKKYTN